MATVRPVEADELDELLALYQHLNPDDPAVDPDDRRDQWTAMLADEMQTTLVVEHDGRLVATCLLSVTRNLTRGGRPFAVIENVVTREDERGRGFGSQCVERAIERADERGCYKVMLLTGTEQEWKRQFYEDCGFDRDAKTGFQIDLRSA